MYKIDEKHAAKKIFWYELHTYVEAVIGNLLTALHEVTSIIDHNINSSPVTLDPLDGLANSLLIRNIDSII